MTDDKKNYKERLQLVGEVFILNCNLIFTELDHFTTKRLRRINIEFALCLLCILVQISMVFIENLPFYWGFAPLLFLISMLLWSTRQLKLQNIYVENRLDTVRKLHDELLELELLLNAPFVHEWQWLQYKKEKQDIFKGLTNNEYLI